MQLTVRAGRPDSGADPDAARSLRSKPARRLRLSADEFALLAEAAPHALPPTFAVPAVPRERRAAAIDGLRRAGAVAEAPGDETTDGGVQPGDDLTAPPVVPAVQATVTVLAGAPLGIDVRVTGAGRGRRAWLAIAGMRGASLVQLGDGAVEVSAFTVDRLSVELARLVPDVTELVAGPDDGTGSGITAALTAAVPERPPAATVPLHLLESSPSAGPMPRGAGDPALRAVLTALRHPVGRLTARVWVLGGGALRTGTVTWAAVAGGWLRLAPDERAWLSGHGRLVRVEPVTPDALADDVLPLLAEGLATAAAAHAAAPRPRQEADSSAPEGDHPPMGDERGGASADAGARPHSSGAGHA